MLSRERRVRTLNRLAHSVRTVRRVGVEERATESDSLRTETQRLDDVGTTTSTAVDEDVELLQQRRVLFPDLDENV
jgi:hypothetical protein